MTKRGKRSTASNVVGLVAPARPRLSPPSLLTKPEQKLFGEVVLANSHLKSGDVPMLAAYVQALAKTYRLARKTDSASHKAWQESGRLALAMARSLRLTAINSTHPEKLARQRSNAAPLSLAERMDMMEDD
jgi:hypothetical protein